MFTEAQKFNLQYIRVIKPKRVISIEAHLHSLAHGQHSFQVTSQRCRAVDNTVSDFTGLKFEPQTSRTDSNVSTTELTDRFHAKLRKVTNLAHNLIASTNAVIHKNEIFRYITLQLHEKGNYLN